MTVACPIAAFWLILPWGHTVIIRYANINGFFKAAGCLVVTSILLYFMRGFMDMILWGESYSFGLSPFDFGDWSNYQTVNSNIDAITFFTFLGLTIIFAVTGTMLEIKSRKNI